MTAFPSFVSFSYHPGKCYVCSFYLDDGRHLLGHDEHAFHEDCIMAILRSNPTTYLGCPAKGCYFVATHINGESIAMILKFMGIRPVAAKNVSQPELPRREKKMFDLDGFMALEGDPSSSEAGMALIIVAREGDNGSKINRLLDFFYSKNVAVSEVDRGNAALAAMNNDRYHAFRILLQGSQRIDPDQFMSISLLAIKNNKPEFVRASWPNNQSPDLLADLIIEAIKFNSFIVAREMLLLAKPNLTDERIEGIHEMAARCGSNEILELLRK